MQIGLQLKDSFCGAQQADEHILLDPTKKLLIEIPGLHRLQTR